MLGNRTHPIIWPLRGKLASPVFAQEHPRYTGWRRIPSQPTMPWVFKDRPQNGQTSFGRYDLPPTLVTRPPTLVTRPRAVHPLMPPVRFYVISGTTRDSAGAALGNCAVRLFFTETDVEADQVTSDASGAFVFKSAQVGQTYYIVAYKPGSPDVAGTTLNTLTGAFP